MPDYRAITKTDFADLRWQRYNHYQFAARDALAPVVVNELAKACLHLPLAFMQQEGQYITAALQGVTPGQNLFVAPDGRWLAGYTPAAYRSYPFALAKGANNQLVICVDQDSGLIGEQFDEVFFDTDGQLGQSVQQIIQFLQHVRQNRDVTLRVCAALDAEGLIQPWPLKVKGRDGAEHQVNGLFRIDETRFNQLGADALYRVHQAGALPVVYCQLLSMQHIPTLGKLAEAHAQVQPSNVDIEAVFGGHDDTLKFDF